MDGSRYSAACGLEQDVVGVLGAAEDSLAPGRGYRGVFLRGRGRLGVAAVARKKRGDASASPNFFIYRRVAGRRLLFDDHAGAHFEVQCVAEVRAVAPVHTGLVGLEGDRLGFLGIDDEVDVVFRYGEAMGEVFHLVQVGEDQGDFVALLDLELTHAVRRSLGYELDRNLVAIAEDAAILGVLDGIGEFIEVVNLTGLDLVALDDDEVVGLRIHGVVGQHLHLLLPDVDDLLVLRVEGADRQEAVLRELAADAKELPVSVLRLRHGGVDMARLVVHVYAIDHVLCILVATMELDCRVDVPLDHLAVEEQRCEGVSAAVKGGVQGAEAQLDFGDDALVEVVERAVEVGMHLGQFDHGGGGRELAGTDEVLAVRTGVHPVGILGYRDVAGEGGLGILVGFLGAVHHRHFAVANGDELAVLDGLLDARHLEEHAGVLFGGHHVLVLCAAFGVVLVGGGELAVEGCGHQIHVAVHPALPAHFHGFGIDTGEERLVLLLVIHVAPVVRVRDVKLVAAEDAGGVVDLFIHRVALVREDPVKALDVGQLGDLVALERIALDSCQTTVDLVVNPEVLAVIGAIGIGTMDVVGIAGLVLQAAVRFGADDGFGFIGDAPAAHAVNVERGYALDFAAGWQAEDAHLARMSAGPDSVVGVQLTRRGVDAQPVGCVSRRGWCRGCRRSAGGGWCGFLLAG